MKIAFCGGAGEVGASCIFVRIDGRNLVLDCGMRMNAADDQMPDLSMIQDDGGADAVFISHAHLDHSGSLPVLSREYPEARIYMTHATKDLIRVLLYDSLKIMESREAEIPAFAEVHVINMLDRVLCFSPGYTFKPFDDDISVTFFNAGHVAGSAAVYITGREGAFFYSGDFSVLPQRTVEGMSIPRLRPDVAVFESTYGNRLHASRSNEEARLVNKVKEVIQSGKKMLIPSFALGRAQEVILILKNAINRGVLPPFNIYVDGMVNDICRIYKLNPNYLKSQLSRKILRGTGIFYDDRIEAVTGKQKQREEIIDSKEPCCIISSSGMLTGGPSQWYAEKLVSDEGNFIAITGYQDEEAPGKQLLELADIPQGQERVLKIGEKVIPVQCGIGKYGLSAHADKTEIVSTAHTLGAHRVFFIHGDHEVTASLASEVQKEYRGRVYAPANGEIFDIDINNPRKQQKRQEPPTLKKGGELSEESVRELWEFVLETSGIDRAFTLEELLFSWNGKKEQKEEEIKQLQSIVYSTSYFKAEVRRPFAYHAAERDKLEEEAQHGPMEVNSMLSLADAWFPPETGLYKKGARFEEKIALLYFNFPRVALEKFNDKIKEFEEATGWKVEINSECNLSAAENSLIELLPEGTAVSGSISYFRNDNRMKANIEGPVSDEIKSTIEMKFTDATGIGLELVAAGSQDGTRNAPVKRSEYQVEQNQALGLIEEAFKGKEDRIYKKSIKQIDGEPCIELAFISPVVGERYRQLLDELECSLLWAIRINPTPNQNEILKIGTRILSENGIPLQKSLSYLPKEMEVRAIIGPCDTGAVDKVRNQFEKKTGLKLNVIA